MHKRIKNIILKKKSNGQFKKFQRGKTILNAKKILKNLNIRYEQNN